MVFFISYIQYIVNFLYNIYSLNVLYSKRIKMSIVLKILICYFYNKESRIQYAYLQCQKITPGE